MGGATGIANARFSLRNRVRPLEEHDTGSLSTRRCTGHACAAKSNTNSRRPVSAVSELTGGLGTHVAAPPGSTARDVSTGQRRARADHVRGQQAELTVGLLMANPRCSARAASSRFTMCWWFRPLRQLRTLRGVRGGR
eukprot:2810941-Rhodomonas_salina.1